LNRFNGSPLWLSVAVKTNGAAAYTALSPLQPLTPAPYALYAPSSGAAQAAANLSPTCSSAGSSAGTI
jgi:hypothetical protein